MQKEKRSFPFFLSRERTGEKPKLFFFFLLCTTTRYISPTWKEVPQTNFLRVSIETELKQKKNFLFFFFFCYVVSSWSGAAVPGGGDGPAVHTFYFFLLQGKTDIDIYRFRYTTNNTLKTEYYARKKKEWTDRAGGKKKEADRKHKTGKKKTEERALSSVPSRSAPSLFLPFFSSPAALRHWQGARMHICNIIESSYVFFYVEKNKQKEQRNVLPCIALTYASILALIRLLSRTKINNRAYKDKRSRTKNI